MQKLAVLLCISMGFMICQASASGTIGYGSRVGMEVDVISMSGLNTSHAIIRTKHTRQNAEKFCREYVGNVTEECIEQELSVPLNDEIHANCNTGVFVDFYGDLYRFEGKLKRKNDDLSANFALRKLSSGELADGSSASGYPTNLAIFRALCPLKVPFGDD